MAISKEVQTELDKITVSVLALQQQHGDMITEINKLERQVKSIVISSVSDSFGSTAPMYNPASMTPESFLREVQEFYISKGIQQNNWVLLIGRSFKSDSAIARWWRVTKPAVTDWIDFENQFKA